MRVRCALMLCLSFLISVSTLLARPARQTPAPISDRATPLGTQRAKPGAPPAEDKDKSDKDKSDKDKSDKDKNKDAAPAESSSQVFQRASNAHAKQALAAVTDSVSEGSLTLFGREGAKATVNVTVTRKGAGKVQRVTKNGANAAWEVSDGTRRWQSMGGGLTSEVRAGPAARLIDMETVRSVASLLEAPAKGQAVKDGGVKDHARVLEIEEPASNKTARKVRYFVDDATSRVTRVEFVLGDRKNLFNGTVSSTDAWVFSDYRTVSGVPTPFHIERFIDGIKVEETQYSTVRFNTSVKDDVFKR